MTYERGGVFELQVLSSGSRVLIISNGHGEDTMGAVFAEALMRRGVHVDAFPVVGLGHSYRRSQIQVVGVQEEMPSGGFLRQGVQPLVDDVRAGFLSLTRRQIRVLKAMARDYDWAVAMGDIYPLWLCGRHLRLPFAFFPTAKSDYIRPHNRLEIAWMRKWPVVVFARDAKTADGLTAQGVRAKYLGNMMMDALQTSGQPLEDDGPLIAILPGSRFEAYHNVLMQLQAVKHLSPRYRYAVALASELDEHEVARRAKTFGWIEVPIESAEASSGLCGRLEGDGFVVSFYKGRFADILHAATVVLGMAGTANEQAVGLGKPVITCPGEGPQFTEAFVAAQSHLLGQSVLVTESKPEALAAGVEKVLGDSELYDRMAAEGRFRMGQPGAAERLAAYCVQIPEFNRKTVST